MEEASICGRERLQPSHALNRCAIALLGAGGFVGESAFQPGGFQEWLKVGFTEVFSVGDSGGILQLVSRHSRLAVGCRQHFGDLRGSLRGNLRAGQVEGVSEFFQKPGIQIFNEFGGLRGSLVDRGRRFRSAEGRDKAVCKGELGFGQTGGAALGDHVPGARAHALDVFGEIERLGQEWIVRERAVGLSQLGEVEAWRKITSNPSAGRLN